MHNLNLGRESVVSLLGGYALRGASAVADLFKGGSHDPSLAADRPTSGIANPSLSRADAERIVASYVPAISEAALKGVTWDTPADFHWMIRKEIARIKDHIVDETVKSGLVKGKERGAVRMELARALHRKVFGGLKLPPYFAFDKGLIEYEPTRKSGGVYIGLVTYHRYRERMFGGVEPSLYT